MKKLLTMLLALSALVMTAPSFAASNSELLEPNFKTLRTLKDQSIEPFFVDWMIDITARHVKEFSGYGSLYELAIPYYEKTNKKEPMFEPYFKEYKAFDHIMYKVCEAAGYESKKLVQTAGTLNFSPVQSKKQKSNIWGCVDKNDNNRHVFVLDSQRYQKLTIRLYSENDFMAFRKEEHKKFERLEARKKPILAKFQDTLKINYQTNWGQVLEIKHPLALIRYKSRTVWFRIEQLTPLGLI